MVSHPQVYLIEYNQQLKDACIKSDKMTSTHKVNVIFCYKVKKYLVMNINQVDIAV